MTFSNPQYALANTAPYLDTSKGKPVQTALVTGTAPVEDESVLDVADEYETPTV